MCRRIGRASVLWLWLWVLPAAAAATETSFRAQVDRQHIALDETLELEVTLQVEGGKHADVELPPTPGFEVLSRQQSEQMSMQFGLGGLTRQQVRTYQLRLRPLEEGTLRILPGTARVGGRSYRTRTIEVEVGPPRGSGTAGGSGPVDAWEPGRQGREDLFLHARLDRDEVWVGEQVSLSVYLFARVDIRGVEGFRLPKMDGFWVGDIASPTQLSPETRMIDGVPYRMYLVSRKALFPLRAGTLQVEPASIDVLVGRGFGGTRRMSRSSPELELQVRELPPGAPRGFVTGNVGSYRLRAEVDRTQVPVGGALTFRQIAEGTGNLGAAELPALPQIEGARRFESTYEDKVRVRQGRYGGEKVVETVLIPEREGPLYLPALEWVVFDPSQGDYVTLRSEPLVVQVGPAEGGGAAVAGGGPDWMPIRRAVRLAPARIPLWERSWFVWAFAAPALWFAAALLAPRLRRRREGGKGRTTAEIRRYLTAAEARIAERKRFYDELDRALRVYLESVLGHEARAHDRHALRTELERAGVPGEEAEALLRMLDRCDEGRFAPFDTEGEGERRQLLDEARRWLEGRR